MINVVVMYEDYCNSNRIYVICSPPFVPVTISYRVFHINLDIMSPLFVVVSIILILGSFVATVGSDHITIDLDIILSPLFLDFDLDITLSLLFVVVMGSEDKFGLWMNKR